MEITIHPEEQPEMKCPSQMELHVIIGFSWQFALPH